MNKIIAAPPACGKTYFTERHPFPYSVDIEYSHYAYITENGKKIRDSSGSKIPNFAFPKNYINEIKKASSNPSTRYIFVGTHEVILRELINQGIEFTVVLPPINAKSEWLKRFEKRNDDDRFIKMQEANWQKWTEELYANSKNFSHIIYLNEGKYIGDLISENKI